MVDKKHTISKKITFVYSWVVIVVFSIILIAYSYRTMKEIKKNFLILMGENNLQLDERINTIIADIDRVSSLSVIDREVQHILGKNYGTDDNEQVADQKKMNRFISISSTLNPFYYQIVFIANNGKYFSNLSYEPHNLEILKEFIPILTQKNSYRIISEVYSVSNSNKYISISRKLLNSFNYEQNGFAFISIKLKDFQNYLDARLENRDSKINTIILSNEDIIYKSNNNVTGKNNGEYIIDYILNNWDSVLNGENEVIVQSKGYLVVGMENELTGWKIVKYIPESFNNMNFRENITYYLFTIIPVFLVLSFLGAFLLFKIIRPISQLSNSLKKVDKDKFEIINERKIKDDEMGELIHSYNQMLVKMKKSLHQNYVAKINQKRIEYKMLEAQINPHFLYNTLNLISSIAELENVSDISKISASLSEMFRHNIKSGTIVKIKDELNQIENYILIQKYRFWGKLEFECRINSEILEYKIIKFILQPLIENAVYHGIEKKQGQGHVKLELIESNNILNITIEDDGVGISKEKLDEINEKLDISNEEYVKKDSFQHMGIENVHFRIKAFYGQQYGIEVFSRENMGTIIKIRIPVVK